MALQNDDFFFFKVHCKIEIDFFKWGGYMKEVLSDKWDNEN